MIWLGTLTLEAGIRKGRVIFAPPRESSPGQGEEEYDLDLVDAAGSFISPLPHCLGLLCRWLTISSLLHLELPFTAKKANKGSGDVLEQRFSTAFP